MPLHRAATKARTILGGIGLTLAAGAAFSFSKMGSTEDYTAAVAAARARLSERPELKDLIRYATLAANGHNTQPWRFRPRERHIDIFPDFTRRTPVVDLDDHHLFASLGCAAENLAIAAAAQGRKGDLRYAPTGDVTIVFEFDAGPSEPSVLFEAIPER